MSMNKEMIISSNGHETRVAILEDDQLAEIFVERERNRGVVGNVYKGHVSKVLPGMQSSFIDLGLERDGFLYVSDVISNFDDFEGAEDDVEPKAQAPDGAEKERGEKDREKSRDKGQPEAKIEELLKEGQDVVVQVAKEPLGTKGARLTCHVTLPGRFLVFMPTVDHIGISRKIATREERTRLRGIVKEFRDQHHFGGGVIIRTAAENRSKEDILADLNYFNKIWIEMRQKSEGRRAPAVIYQEPSLVNNGRYVGKKTAGRLEDTIIKTNLEAAKEIVRQIRLRDLGGIIVCDFIDMEEKKNRQKVFQAVEQELRKDRAPSKALQVSDFGLVIVTRKRVKQSLERVLTEPCPYCSGAGTIKSSSTVCYEILTEMKKLGPDLDGPGVLLRVNPDIARALKEEERGVLKDLKSLLGRDVIVKPDVHLHHEQFDVMSIGG
jgi:Ribonuclease G/E